MVQLREDEVERRQRLSIDGASDAIVTLDASCAILTVNPAVERMFGYPPDELTGRKLTVLMPLSPAAFAGPVRIVAKADIDYLNCSFDQLSLAVTHFGTGMQDCLQKETEKNSTDQE